MADDKARSLKDPDERARRSSMLNLPHMKNLTAYVNKLRERPGVEVPDFDPLDGGERAEVLFLLEKPGPMTSASGSGSGFISRNNDDQTAANTFCFMKMIAIPREATALWNVIPWWDRTIALNAVQRREGEEQLKYLLKLLPCLKAIVLVGRNAARARQHFSKYEPNVFESAHPSARVRARWRQRWDEIPTKWALAIPLLSEEVQSHVKTYQCLETSPSSAKAI